MKFSKLNLHHYAATRAKLGLSQRQLAELLGISKAAVALAETWRRSLPTAALIKYGQLEIKINAVMPAGTTATKKENSINLPVPVFTEGGEDLSIEQQYLATKLRLMTERYNIVQGQLRLLDAIIEKELDVPGNMFLLGLQVHRDGMLKRLKTCNLIKQTSLQNKLNLLSAKEQMNQADLRITNYDLRFVEDRKVFKSFGGSVFTIDHSPFTVDDLRFTNYDLRFVEDRKVFKSFGDPVFTIDDSRLTA